MTYTFKMAGGLGDIIYALPAMRELGGGTLAICPSEFTNGELHSADRLVGPEAFAGLPELITTATDYVERADVLADEVPAKFDLNRFRMRSSLNGPPNLAQMILERFECNPKAWLRQWLALYPAELDAVLIQRTARYHNPVFPWRELVNFYAGRCQFLGRVSEHREFCQEFGWLPLRNGVLNLLDFATAIAAGRLFAGNQSVGYAIAEGLKRSAILEQCELAPNCNYERADALVNPAPDKFPKLVIV